MTFQETLDFLYSALPVFHKSGPSAIKKGLGNISALCSFLGNPEKKFKSIHIGGTNGKGSSSHMIASILQSAGYKTGLYTSPHLKSFTERIKINGKEIDALWVVQFVERIMPVIKEIQPSFFEVTVAMAFEYYATSKVDIVVVEVGLGGRLDSTNIIEPEVSMITNISFDHQYILGNTLREIALEKAGIIKGNTPVVISERENETQEIFISFAKEKSSDITFASDEFTITKYDYQNGKLICDVEGKRLFLDKLVCGLGGSYQLKNIKGVLSSVLELRNKGFEISESAIREGMAMVCEQSGFKGRWQILQKNPMIICDTGHNVAGIIEVMQQLKSIPNERLFVVFGMVSDKDVDAVLKLLPKTAFYFFTQSKLPRALPATVLAEKAMSLSLQGVVVEDVNQAILDAKNLAGANDLIFVGGSTFVVAEVEDL